MPTLEFTNAARSEEDRARAAQLFPGSLYGEPSLLSLDQFKEFESAIESDSEEAIQSAIEACPYLLSYIVPNSGHHGTWVFPKPMIRSKRADGTSGLIPDFLIATRNSLGFQWQIVELKRPSYIFSNSAGNGYSTAGHKGIAQCANYLSHFTDYIETVRANIGVSEIITPEKVILVMGKSSCESDSQRICRANFERMADRVLVASYDRISSAIRRDHESWFTHGTD